MAWSGAIVDIPTGYQLCDGTNGTPDLRDKFVAGSGTTYSPGDTGGAVNHNHTFTGDGHTHDVEAGTDLLGFGIFGNKTTSKNSAGTTNNANGLPPYYSLAYIMFLGA